jgi:group I intron endonuclease
MEILTTKQGVYLLTNKINDKIYVGKAINLKDRMRRHQQSEVNAVQEHPISLAIKKYGWENFEISILETFEGVTNEELLNKETEWIKKLNATNRNIGYNILEHSNDWTGHHHTPETKLKLAKIFKERFGGISPFMGKKHTEETKQRLSEIAKKRTFIPFKGRKHTEESKEKMRQASLGQTHPELRKAIKQINPLTNEIIKIWDYIGDAAEFFTGNKKKICSIREVCLKYTDSDGYLRKTAYGFKWEYVNK